MALDPRTPVIVGVGQALNHPASPSGPDDLVDPLDLMEQALRIAGADAHGTQDSSAVSATLAALDVLTSVVSFTWRPSNPSAMVAERLGISPAQLRLSVTGGSVPQKLVADAAQMIAAGKADVVGIAGSEAMHSRSVARRHPEWQVPEWPSADGEPAAQIVGHEIDGLSPLEIQRGIVAPISIYPLFDNAWRAQRGVNIEDHRRQLGKLWASFSSVASQNPNAWIANQLSADEIIAPSASNRMISEPYTKFMVANLPVDMGAAVLLCSVEKARALGIGEDRWVFPLAHVHGDDPHHISDRPSFDRSPAIKRCGMRLTELAGIAPSEADVVDLYSCFPIAVILGAQALGLDLDDPSRPLSVTGGLTFGGGPGNNYVTHSIATMVDRLRNAPGQVGLVSGLSWFATSHALGLYSTTPPERGFLADDVQQDLDGMGTQRTTATLPGPATVETFTIVHDREGPCRVIAALKDAGGTRAWGTIDDRDVAADLSMHDLVGRTGSIDEDGALSLD